MGSGPLKGKSAQDGPPSDDESASSSKASESGEATSVFQAGGHGKLAKDPEQEGAIRKAANESEIIFYQTLNGDDPQLVKIPDHIRSFFPKFYGVIDKKHIVMEDLTHDIKQACVMDIKMGTKTYTNDSNMVKQWMLDNKDHKTTTSVLGFRITGFRAYRQSTGEYDVKGKPWGMALTPEDMAENLITFFDDGTKIRLDVLKKYIERLEVLLDWYSQQNIIKIYSSSLLFVYDSDNPSPDSATVHMIDFAHVKRIEDPEVRDTRYCVGLRNLIEIFQKIHETHSLTIGTTLLRPGTSTPDTKSPRKKEKEKEKEKDKEKDKEGKKRETKVTDSNSSTLASNSSTPHLDIPTDSDGKVKTRKRASSKSSLGDATPHSETPTPTIEVVPSSEKIPKSPKAPRSPRSPRSNASTASDGTSTPTKLSQNGEGTPTTKRAKKTKTPRDSPPDGAPITVTQVVDAVENT